MRVVLCLLGALLIAASIYLYFLFNKVQPELVFLSGAGMKAPVLEIKKKFEHETGVRVQVHFEGSSILRDYIIKFQTGDLFLPGDKKNLDVLKAKDLVKEQSFIAWHVVSILVAPSARERIKGLDDLTRKGVALAMSNPEQASLGRIVTQKIIEKHPQGQRILDNVVVYGSSSQDVLRLYREGGIDAIIEWDVMAATPEGKGLVVVPLEEPYTVRDELYVGLLSCSRNPALARRFYNYLLTNGKDIFRRHGYDIDQNSEAR